MMMKKFKDFSAIALAGLLFWATPVSANPSIRNLSGKCQEAIARAGQEISRRYQVPIKELKVDNMEGWPETPFPQSNSSLMFIIGNGPNRFDHPSQAKARNFFNSPKLQLSFVKPIFKDCSNIDVVQFAFAYSDDAIPHFRMPSGEPITGIWVCQGRYDDFADLTWGYYYDCPSNY
ncbi:hypothetical protein VZH09_13875 (plasmid) [Synechococcus elongatus IITB7]|uniref:hypothetical protein n=1 Tax=Synechococcus elongatus TaxID=32046 RepID=UPI0030CE6E0D